MLQKNLDLEDSSSRKIKHLIESFQALNKNASMKTQLSKKHTNLFFDNIDRAWELYESVMSLTSQNIKDTGLFGITDTSVYMTLSHNLCRHRTSGTQATASINKSFQVCDKWKNRSKHQIDNSDYCSTCSITTFSFREYSQLVSDNLINPEIYFFGKKKETSELKGMGSIASQVKLQKTSQTTNIAAKSDVKKKSSKSSINSSSTNTAKKPSSTIVNSKQKPNLPAKISKGAATTSGTSKTVTIKDEKSQKPCAALGTKKGDMMITVSHIKIGPKETCPVHGNDPCQGPKCVLASSGEEQGSVKVTTVNNPRRGVFEIVIRKLTGAPLAKNELMLEWTPPPSHSSPCNAPCPIPYITPRTCRHSKCKFIVCRPSPCRPKCSKKKPCGQICCQSRPCKKCCKATCCGNPCRPCKPCPPRPPLCCPPPQCDQCFQACKMPCAVPCKSSPCIKPCPIGRKRPRKSRSQPRIKSHHKKLSPCYNRSKACPVVRCRSIPGPCTLHCGIRQFCLPRNCSSILPCKLNKSSVESSLKSCSSCCG